MSVNQVVEATATGTSTVAPSAAVTNLGIPLGYYLVGFGILISASDTEAGPLIAWFLAAVAVYNGIKIYGGSKAGSNPAINPAVPAGSVPGLGPSASGTVGANHPSGLIGGLSPVTGILPDIVRGFKDVVK